MREINVMVLFSECVFCLIAALTIVLSKSIDTYKRRNLFRLFLCGSVLFICDVHSWLYDGKTGMFASYWLRIATFLAFFMPYVLMVLYHIYVVHSLFGNYKQNREKLLTKRRYGLVFGCAFCASLVNVMPLFNQWVYYFDENNVYMRGPLYGLAYAFGFVALVADASILLQYRKNTSDSLVVALLSYVISPGIALVAQQYTDNISMVNISIGISMVIMYVVTILEQNKLDQIRSRQIYEAQIDLMLSQVGPHFIYNTLTTIKHLCKKDPGIAMETIDEFAAYLRGNLDSLTVRQKIPFNQELKHVKNYISIEKKRFGDRVQVDYDLETTDFEVPALVLQPLVENAIKHGIMKKEEGGHIIIRSYKNDIGYVVLVEDDGIGFDVAGFEQRIKTEIETVTLGQQELTKRHLGIENVRNRIESMCGGTLIIDSIRGKKTQVVLTFPYEEKWGLSFK